MDYSRHVMRNCVVDENVRIEKKFKRCRMRVFFLQKHLLYAGKRTFHFRIRCVFNLVMVKDDLSTFIPFTKYCLRNELIIAIVLGPHGAIFCYFYHSRKNALESVEVFCFYESIEVFCFYDTAARLPKRYRRRRSKRSSVTNLKEGTIIDEDHEERVKDVIETLAGTSSENEPATPNVLCKLRLSEF